ncbi:GntR family transcriptional regulator [Falsochrobactrum ovis]|uniref:GntR family transcriptional regulator n=1 Tax=Falsochrobactrum ovis TaxID=1293442 RepID=A0A364JS11_9HYPH|nr:GntR family transcriptional regulator [Falsochrobactrum ovis]RAK25726.1 GntR family transcriptional regulator [Falsochrobactrum ovis]
MPFNMHEPPFSRLLTSNDPRRDHPKSLVEFAYEQLLSMLMTMKLEPGAHIGIEALARELGISQTPIREALTLLEAQKLVHKIPNVGFRTANLLSREDVNALFEIRLLLEPAMAALAAERANDRTLKHLTLIAKKLELSSKGNETAYAQFAEGDAHLHQLIAAATGNRFIADANESLHVHLHIFRLLYKTNSTERAVTEHAKLIEALNARDPAAAEQAMREHLIASRDRLDNAMLAQEADK